MKENTDYVNKYLVNKSADYTVFVSIWRWLFYKQGLKQQTKVILAGANKEIFNADDFTPDRKKVKIVTHHWGANWNKGFDIYSKIDNLIGKLSGNKIDFTYIGNT